MFIKNLILGIIAIFFSSSLNGQTSLEILSGGNSSFIIIYNLEDRFRSKIPPPRRHAFIYGLELITKKERYRIGGRSLISRKGYSYYDGNLIHYLEFSGFYDYRIANNFYAGGQIYGAKKIKGREVFVDYDLGLGISLSYDFGLIDTYVMFQHGLIQVIDNPVAFHYNQVIQLGCSIRVFEFDNN